jgi:hypothetical protein
MVVLTDTVDKPPVEAEAFKQLLLDPAWIWAHKLLSIWRG